MKTNILLTISCAAMLAACGGGGGGGGDTPVGPAPAGNLAVLNVTLTSAAPNAAHEMVMKTTIQASARFSNVPIAYVLLDKDHIDNGTTPARQHLVGEAVIPDVPEGTMEWDAFITVPAEVRQERDWYLAPFIDMTQEIPETNEDDNQPSKTSRIPLTILETQADTPDVVIEYLEADVFAMTLTETAPAAGPLEITDPRNNSTQSVEDKPDADFTGSLVLTSTGANEVSDIVIYADLFVVENGGLGNLIAVYPLLVYDPRNANPSSTAPYEDYLDTSIKPGQPTSISIDVIVPELGLGIPVRDRVRDYLNSPGATEQDFYIGFFADKGNVLIEYEGGNLNDPGVETGGENGTGNSISNNEIYVPFCIELPPPPPQPEPRPQCIPTPPIQYAKSYTPNLIPDNDYFGLGLDFGFEAALDERGATGLGTAGVPVTVFGSTSRAVNARLFGQTLPRTNSPINKLEFTFDVFGRQVFSHTRDIPNYSYSEPREAISETYKKTGVVMVGPVPVTVEGSVTGTLGATLSVDLTPSQFRVEIAPYARLTAGASASVSSGIFTAGFGGSMTLLDNVLTGRAVAQLTPPNASGLLTGTATLELVNVLTGPSGRLFIYAEYPWPKFCSAGLLGDIIPCGFSSKRKEFTLARFPAVFERTDVLFRKTASASVCVSLNP